MPDVLPRFERIAHRGASTQRFENTLPAFLLALEQGADAVELDVHQTRDGVVVVHHDEHVAGLPIAASDWRSISRISIADGAHVPQLKDVLDAVGDRAEVYIELKGRGVADAAIDVACRHGKRFAVHSFDHDAIERAMLVAPDVARGVLLDEGTPDPGVVLADAHHRVRPRDAWPHYSLVDAAFMQAAASISVRVIAWTVNSLPEAHRLAELGVAGICTDDVRIIANL